MCWRRYTSCFEKKSVGDGLTRKRKLFVIPKIICHELDLILMCDVSSYGVGAVLAHCIPYCSESPIGFASRSLSASQRNYLQIEKEALALGFGVQRIHAYISVWSQFELSNWSQTINRFLIALLHQHRLTSTQASARIRRWSLLLSAYEYTIRFRNTLPMASVVAERVSSSDLLILCIHFQHHLNASCRYRHADLYKYTEQYRCTQSTSFASLQPESKTPPERVLLLEHLEVSPVTEQHIRVWTRRDHQLSRVLQFVKRGWPLKLL